MTPDVPASSPLRVLGVDPGLSALGYGVLEHHCQHSRLITSGCLTTPSDMPFLDRLLTLYTGLKAVVEATQPAVLVCEKLLVIKHAQVALSVGQARGVAALAAAERHLAFMELTPAEVKQAVTGSGRAGKEQVQRMVQRLLNLPELPQPHHAADALALALAYVQSHKLRALLEAHGVTPRTRRGRGARGWR